MIYIAKLFSWEGTLPQDQNKKYCTMFVSQTSILIHLVNKIEQIKNQWGFWVVRRLFGIFGSWSLHLRWDLKKCLMLLYNIVWICRNGALWLFLHRPPTHTPVETPVEKRRLDSVKTGRHNIVNESTCLIQCIPSWLVMV